MQPLSTPMKISENREVRTNELNFEYNTNGHNKNDNIAKKCQKNQGDNFIVLTTKWHLRNLHLKTAKFCHVSTVNQQQT